MAQTTGILWCHHTANFWIGCTRVSDGCDHCYAETQQDHRYHRVIWGGERRQTTPATRLAPLRWNKQAKADGVRRRVFCMSLGDFFDNQVDPAWRTEVWTTIRLCRQLDWLILTKRPGNIAKMLPPGWNVWPNVWLGCTVENQQEADRRIPILLAVPAAIHWLSCEPFLEPLNLRRWLGPGRIDWIVAGGESGHHHRPMKLDWCRDLMGQCQAEGVAFFMKQVSAQHPRDHMIPPDLMVRDYPHGRG
jgi:protein gp37